MYVLMISPNNFPENDAGAIRDACFARIYQELGYEVYHIGMNPNLEYGIYKDIEYYSLYKNNLGILRKIKNVTTYRYRLSVTCQKIFKAKGYPEIIHIYDLPKSGIEWARNLAIAKGIRIIHDSVEWYSPCEFKGGKFSYQYFLKKRTNTKLIRNPIYVYAISSYLEKYYISKGLKTLRVPVIMNSEEYKPLFTKNKVIKLVYAGSPAKKDHLDTCLKAFSSLCEEERKHFIFNIYGADKNFVESCLSGKNIPEIIAHGRVKRDEVIKALSESDFSVLIRPTNEVYAKAGFPTKSVEAMMNGCAMLCNLTSDLDRYLVDGENCIIISDETSESMAYALRRILMLDSTKIMQMKRNANATALANFDYKKWVDTIKLFIER